jgi:ribosomal protein S18 acetylase RimI-like enzyme
MKTTENLTYRQGGLHDLEELSQLRKDSYGQFSTELSIDNWNKLNRSLQDKGALVELIKKSTPFICEDDHIVGMAYLVPNGHPTNIFDSEWAYIRMVGVHPDYRGKGISKTLTQMCIDHAKLTGERTLALHTSEFMNAARHIYESIGFQQVKEIAPIFGKRYWLYKLDLTEERN